jgi:hypothetical protein
MTGLDAVSRASYLTKENLFLAREYAGKGTSPRPRGSLSAARKAPTHTALAGPARGRNYGLLLAGAVIAMIPCVVVYVALQRFYVRGLVSGALKG